MECSDIRQVNKSMLMAQGIDPNLIDNKYTLYYDETNNIKKFRLDELSGDPNVALNTIFVLGGIEGCGSIPLEELRNKFKLQSNIKEVKSKHIYKGKFEDCLKSSKLETYFDIIEEKGWHFHFRSVNLLYWSIVDVLDSIDACVKDDVYGIVNLKAMLYTIVKSDMNIMFDLMHKYKYPDIHGIQRLHEFFKELIDLVESRNVKDYLYPLKRRLIDTLKDGTRQASAPFIQNEQSLILMNEFSHIYEAEIYTWINSQLIFDRECDIENAVKNETFFVDNNRLYNYSFTESNSNTMIQLSDVAVGIIGRYLHFIDNYGDNIGTIVNSFNDIQKRNFLKLNRILKMSCTYNPIFFNQINSIEYHCLFNRYVDEYGR